MVQIQLRRGTAAEWTSADPTLAAGEIGLETDTGLYKIGTGATAWTSLGYGMPKTQMSVTSDSSGLKLSGDAATPGNSKYYGTDGSGAKGYFALPSVGISDVVSDTTPQLGGELDCNSHTIGDAEYNNGDSGTSKTIDWKLGNHQKVTMTGDCTFTFTAPTKPCMLSLRFINDATAGRTRTLPTIKYPASTAPSWSTAANAVDILSLYYDGSAYYGQAGIAFG